MTAAPGQAWTVVSVQVGVPAPLATSRGTVPSSIARRVVEGRVTIGPGGLAGNVQGDTVNHGGPDKAACVYVASHVAYWAERLGRDMPPGAFGENLTVDGPDEDHACIGDTYRVGTALLQVSQPRQPCYKLAARHAEERLVKWVVDHGSTGYYFRVIDSGEVWAGAPVVPVARPHPRLTVTAANRVMHRAPFDADGARGLLVPELAASWVTALERRLDAVPLARVSRGRAGGGTE